MLGLDDLARIHGGEEAVAKKRLLPDGYDPHRATAFVAMETGLRTLECYDDALGRAFLDEQENQTRLHHLMLVQAVLCGRIAADMQQGIKKRRKRGSSPSFANFANKSTESSPRS
jgi:hypothetical protein